MHKLLLVVPDHSNTEINKYIKTLTIPYGVLSLASYVEYYCPETKCEILDFNAIDSKKNPYEELRKKLIEFNPDFLGISAMFNSSFDQIGPICEMAKSINQDINTFAGGVLATNLVEDIFETTELLDAISYGEGEIPLKDMFLSDNIKETLKTHRSWITKNDFINGKKASVTFVQNLDDIPLIDYSKIDINKYTGRTTSDDNLEKRSLPIHSTRGCPYNCIFCCAATNHGKKLRYMSAERFLSDVKTIVDKYQIQKISIDDDQFLFYRERAVKILKGLAELNIEIELASGVNVKFIDKEIASLLKKAGLEIAFIAVESGSQRMLKEIIDKPLDVSQVKPAVEALRNEGLLVHAPFLFGIPGETDEDRALTRQLILEVGFDWNFIFVATPFKGSRLYDVCVDNNYIQPTEISNLNVYKCVIKAPGIDPDEITKYTYELNLDVNFVNNYNYHSGNYKVALGYFSRIAKKYPEHAFAHYYSAKCYKKLGDNKQAQCHMDEYEKIIERDNFWKQYAIDFKLDNLYVKK